MVRTCIVRSSERSSFYWKGLSAQLTVSESNLRPWEKLRILGGEGKAPAGRMSVKVLFVVVSQAFLHSSRNGGSSPGEGGG